MKSKLQVPIRYLCTCYGLVSYMLIRVGSGYHLRPPTHSSTMTTCGKSFFTQSPPSVHHCKVWIKDQQSVDKVNGNTTTSVWNCHCDANLARSFFIDMVRPINLMNASLLPILDFVSCIYLRPTTTKGRTLVATPPDSAASGRS